MNELLRTSAAHVFVDNLASPVLDLEDEHHLLRVLRIKDGERITLSDGHGSWASATVGKGNVELDSDIFKVNALPITRLAFVPLKGDRNELVVQKATEIGVPEIVVSQPTSRSVVRWDERKAANELRRLQKIAREAAMQSRRLHLPVVTGLVALSEIATGDFAVAEPGGVSTFGISGIAVGPEGGFSADELAMFTQTVDLGDTVLRAETAAIVASARLVSNAKGGPS